MIRHLEELIREEKSKFQIMTIKSKMEKHQVYLESGGYRAFVEAVEEFVSQGKIKPVKRSGDNGMSPALYNTYQKIAQRKSLSDEEVQKILTQYHPKMQMNYYLKHPDAYQKVESYLSAIDKFLKGVSPSSPQITANERSFDLFRDEKWLMSAEGKSVVGKLGICLADLHCFKTNEPFMHYQRTLPSEQNLNALIIENLDTYTSMKMLFQKGVYEWNGVSFALLIYGEGNKIMRSFSYFHELQDFQGHDVDFYYFGDLDWKGIDIWYDLQVSAGITVKPFCFFYETLIDLYEHEAKEIKKDQTFHLESTTAFLNCFSNTYKERISVLLESKRYLPNEGLSAPILLELSGREGS